MSYENFSKGSEWHKWDLQACTNKYINYKGPTLTPKQLEVLHELTSIDKDIINSRHDTISNSDYAKLYVEYLIKFTDLSAIAITNHNTGDGIQEIIEYLNNKQKENYSKYGKLTIFPGVEIGGNDKCHILIVFNPNTKNKHKYNFENDGKTIKSELSWKEYIDGFLNAISIPNPRIYSNIPANSSSRGAREIISLSEDWDFIPIFPHINNGDGCFRELQESNRIELFKNINFGIVDVKSAQANTDLMKTLNGENNKYGNKKIACIETSDATTITEIGKHYTWIKSETTFEGLKQLFWEPRERVKIQEVKPENKKAYNIIEKVKFIDNTGENKFTDKEIGFSSGLNAIIGGKSSGKSLLLYMLAKAISNTENTEENDKKYQGVTTNTELEIYYADDPSKKRTLEDGRIIEYLPQLYIDKIVRDDQASANHFNGFILKLVRQEKEVDDLYIAHETMLDEVKTKLTTIITNWVNLDRQLANEKEALKPMGDKESIKKEIKGLEIKISELIKKSGLSEEELKTYNSLNSKNVEIADNIKNINLTITSLENLKNYVTLSLLNDFDNSIVFNDENTEVLGIFASFKQKIRDGLDKEVKAFCKEIDIKIKEKQDKLSTLSQDISKNNETLKPLKEKIKAQGEIAKYKADKDLENEKVNSITKKEAEISELKKQRDNINFLNDYKKIFESYNTLITSLNELIKKKWEQNKTGITLNASLIFDNEKFVNLLAQSINMKTHLDNQFNGMGFNASKYIYSTTGHNDNIDKMLKSITSDINRFSNFKAGGTETLLRALLSNCYDINFDIKRGNDNLKQMSEGKKGIVVLQLYLSLSKSDCPILIDQPEDNLDNRTVYTELNDYIKDCKKRRQIIMISHNANLVVNTDAENVIVANHMGEDGKENKKFEFEYVNGALENTFESTLEKGILYQKGIREHVCEILEGGTDAFKKRERKYQISDDN